jgi:multimeric flavodoxin WrbA
MKMRAVVLNGARTEDAPEDDTVNLLSEVITSELQRSGFEVDNIVLREKRIASCTGCFGCWLRTPGKCLIDDDGRKVAEKAIQSNLLVYLTPVTFGGYSSELKKALDRMACSNLLPFLKKMGGEVHHPTRYENHATIVAFGVLPSQEVESEAIFESLVVRNSINHHADAYSTIVYSTDTFDVVQKNVESILAQAGVAQ